MVLPLNISGLLLMYCLSNLSETVVACSLSTAICANEVLAKKMEPAIYTNAAATNLEWGYTDEGPHNARISPHYPSQYMDTPLWNGKDNTKHIPKLKSPWGFKTPKGYSSFFFSPRYSDSLIEILPAIVDTDMHHEVNFPFVYKGEEGVQNKIELGTPVIQVIPFKRQDWASSVSEKEYRKRGKFRAYLSQAYLKLHHSKKRYR